MFISAVYFDRGTGNYGQQPPSNLNVRAAILVHKFFGASTARGQIWIYFFLGGGGGGFQAPKREGCTWYTHWT